MHALSQRTQTLSDAHEAYQKIYQRPEGHSLKAPVTGVKVRRNNRMWSLMGEGYFIKEW